MPSSLPTSINNNKSIISWKQKPRFSSDNLLFSRLVKTVVAISALVVLYLFLLVKQQHSTTSPTSTVSQVAVLSTTKPRNHHHRHDSAASPTFTDTDITHLVFGLVSSVKSWKARRPYIESWWKPNVHRGYILLDKTPGKDLLPWPWSSPPFRISDDYSRLEEETKNGTSMMVRMVMAIWETFRDQGDDDHDQGVRWYVMAFDDSILFPDNWVDVLAKYDHNKYYYIGGQAETLMSDMFFSFDQGFGGAGIALSYPLVAAMVKDLQGCIRRYPYVISADQIIQFCVDEFGVSLTVEKGIHQIDLKGDISGFLSAHPQAPLLSLHHFDSVAPIFPSLSRIQSAHHLMKAAEFDHTRLLQQTVCYDKQRNWSFSVSWGYSVHIYERFIARSMLKRPLETFKPWLKKETTEPPFFLFNTRWPCETPNVFYFENINMGGKTSGNQILTTYERSAPPMEPNCGWRGNHFAQDISKVQVFSSASKRTELERSECCDVRVDDTNAEVRLRACKDDEIIG